MRRLAIGAVAALALAACASNPDDRGGGLIDRVAGRHIREGDRAHVVITGVSSAADALPLAVAHCGHVGRSARYAGREGDDFRYTCVPG
jgi:hypothetical protein